MKIVFELLLYQLSFIISTNYYQLLSEFSFDMKDPTLNKTLSYNRHGNLIVQNSTLLLTPNISNSMSSLLSTVNINTNSFEIQINFNTLLEESSRTGFIIWFTANSTLRTFNLSTKLSGFGFIIDSYNKTRGSQTKMILISQPNENDNLLTGEQIGNLNQSSFTNFCSKNLEANYRRLTISYDSRRVRLSYNTDSNGFVQCGQNTIITFSNKIHDFQGAILGVNGRINNTDYLGIVNINKVSVFNLNNTFKDNYGIPNSGSYINESGKQKERGIINKEIKEIEKELFQHEEGKDIKEKEEEKLNNDVTVDGISKEINSKLGGLLKLKSDIDSIVKSKSDSMGLISQLNEGDKQLSILLKFSFELFKDDARSLTISPEEKYKKEMNLLKNISLDTQKLIDSGDSTQTTLSSLKSLNSVGKDGTNTFELIPKIQSNITLTLLGGQLKLDSSLKSSYSFWNFRYLIIFLQIVLIFLLYFITRRFYKKEKVN